MVADVLDWTADWVENVGEKARGLILRWWVKAVLWARSARLDQ
jgi:hypothetical protein